MDIARRELLLGSLSLAAGALCWGVGAAPVLAGEVDEPVSSRAEALAEARIAPWEGGSPDEITALRSMNPEYDLMARTFTAMGLGDLALAAPDRWRDRALRALDTIIADTSRHVADRGPAWFLLPYWGYRDNRGERRSLHVDSQRLMVLAIRRTLAEHAGHAALSAELGAAMARTLEAAPARMAESYPDECWVFDHAVALAALRITGTLDGDLYAGIRETWLGHARAQLCDPATGLLVSATDWDGEVTQQPEGSTIWLTAHMLRLLDPELATAQYRLARRLLGRTPMGFGFAREWPAGTHGQMDVDSGPIVPGLGASPSSSGMAILAARSFGDRRFEGALLASLALAAGPHEEGGQLRYRASNAIGDAVIFAGATAGPLWDAVGARGGA